MPTHDTEVKLTDRASPVARNIAASMSNMAFALGNFGGMAGRAVPAFNMLSGSAEMLGSKMGLGGAGLAGMARFLPVIGVAVAGAVIGFGKLNEIATRCNQVLATSIDRFREFEKGVREVGSIIRATPDQLDYLGDRVSALSVAFGTDLGTQTKAYYNTLSAGFTDLEQSGRLMEQANKLAVAGVTDVNSAVDLLTTTLNSYTVGADAALQHSDALFKTVEIGKTTIPELTAHMGVVAASASSLGIPIEELGASLATLTLAGHNTAMASTEMARLYGTLTKATDDAKAKFKQYGIEVSEARIKQEGLLPLMRDINAATGGSQEKLRELITEERAFRAALILSGEGLANFERSMTAMGDTAGATDKAMSLMTDSIDYQMRRWAAFKESLVVSVGQAVAPLLKTLLDGLNKVIGAFNSLPKEARQLIAVLAASAIAIPAVTKGALGLVWSFAKVAIGIGLLTSLTVVFLPYLLPIAGLMLGAASAAVILAYSIKQHMPTAGASFMDSMKRIGQALKFAVAFIQKGEISGAMVEEWDKTDAGVRTMTGKIMVAWDAVKAVFQSAKEVVVATLDGMSASLGPGMTGITDWIKSLLDGGTSAKEFAAKIPMEDLKEFGRGIGHVASAVLWLGKAFITVSTWISGAIGWISEKWEWFKSNVLDNPLAKMALGLGLAIPGAMLGGVGAAPGTALMWSGAADLLTTPVAKPQTSTSQIVTPPPVHQRAEKTVKGEVKINQNILNKLQIDGRDVVTALKERIDEWRADSMEGDIEVGMSTV